MDDGGAQVFPYAAFLAGKVTNKAANEAVTSASGVDHFFQRVGRGNEQPLGAGQNGTMLAFFHDHIFWAEFVNAWHSGDDIVFLNEL